MRHNPTILCVDDEQLSLTVRKMVLEQQGYEVLAASNADEALMLSSANDVDLVLTDYYLTGMLGTELAKKIKKRKPQLTVVILSGVAEIPAGMEHVDAFLSKTLTPPEMLAEVARLLEDERDRRVA